MNSTIFIFFLLFISTSSIIFKNNSECDKCVFDYTSCIRGINSKQIWCKCLYGRHICDHINNCSISEENKTMSTCFKLECNWCTYF